MKNSQGSGYESNSFLIWPRPAKQISNKPKTNAINFFFTDFGASVKLWFVKMEFEKLYSLNELSELLTKSGFYLTMFNIDPSYHQSMSSGVTIYGTKNIIK